jgi:hypothetical protein
MTTIVVPADVYPDVMAGHSADDRQAGWEEMTGWRIIDRKPCERGCWIHFRRCRCEEAWPDGDAGWLDHIFCVRDPKGGRHYLAQPYWFHPEDAEDLSAWCRDNGLDWGIGYPPSFWYPTMTVPILISDARTELEP